MSNVRLLNALFIGILTALWMAVGSWNGTAAAAENGQSKTVGGVTGYLGVVPAEVVKGPLPHSAERPMHGRVPKGSHEHHIVAAIFDATTGARISDATVTAQVSGLGLAGSQKPLERMEIANTITYGAFFNLPGRDLYTIKLTIQRPGEPQPVSLQFKYDHRS
jgi:hypothetical protein